MCMSNQEIKGNLLELIAKIDDRKSLEELAKIVELFVGNHSVDDFAKDMSESEKQNLDIAIKENADKSNLTDHESVMKSLRNDKKGFLE